MTEQQKQRILKMIEVYMDALDTGIACGLNLHMDNMICSSIEIEANDEREVTYLEWHSFNKDIKEMEEYIKGAKDE